ncbi:ANTAR domain-containing protein [Arthrobacter sp. H14]|uniref:ANTAR domain-containing protein n=1 Tax=Arthrobacter sp. H14 TaxID=1312959 RepID=UPI0004ADDD25|nr:ANTAR domain-containing protein [Arthrobacter sp. H14]
MKTRTTIDLAVGIIMGQSRCSQDEAFALLRSASSTRNIKLREVAAGIVASTGSPPASTHFNR